jgi:hypothetical protein
VCLPCVAAIVALLARHWGSLAYSDNAIIELRVREAFQSSIFEWNSSRLNTRTLGPAQKYLMAPLYWLTGGRTVGMHIATAVWTAAMSALAIDRAWRRCALLGGLMSVGLLGVLFGLSPAVWADPWNPHLAIVAMPALIVLAADIAEGDDRAALWGLALASITVQFHSSVIAPVGAIAAAATALRWRRRRGVARPTRRTAVVVVAALWALPIAESFIRPPGNLARLAKMTLLSDERNVAVAEAASAAAAMANVLPAWAFGSALRYLADLPVPVLSAAGSATWVVLWIIAWRRRTEQSTALLAIVATLVPVALLATWRLPGDFEPYMAAWTIPAGTVGLVVLVWSLTTTRTRHSQLTTRRLVGMIVTVACLVTVSGIGRLSPELERSQRTDDVAGALQAALPAGGEVYVDAPRSISVPDMDLAHSVILELTKRGFTVAVPGWRKFYDGRDRTPPPGAWVVSMIGDGDVVWRDGTTVVAIRRAK